MAAHQHSHKYLYIAIVVFLVFALLVGLKFVSAKAKWYTYVVQSQQSVTKYKIANSVEDAGIIAATIVSMPANNPLYKQPVALEELIQSLSHQTGRDIVIVDNQKKILGDTVASNVGTIYTYDNGEIAKTLLDGQARTFIEKSADYPSGINETVISFKNLNGQVVGAIIISDSKIFN